MPSSARWSAILLPLALLANGIAASSAAAQDRCEGTLCDLYYGNASAPKPSSQTQQPAATPMTVPSGGILGFFTGNRAATPAAPGTAASGTTASGAPARAPLVQVQGGGLVGLAKGTTPDRCEGTLCDLYYGGPPPEKVQPAQAAAPTATVDAADTDDAAPRPTRVRRATSPGVQYEKPHCAATAANPWKCYR